MTEADSSTGLVLGSLSSIGTSGVWLRDRLAEALVDIKPSSQLARGLSQMDEFRERALRGELFKFGTTDLAFDFFAGAIGTDFLSKALHAGWEAGFTLPQKRWSYLASGNPLVTKPASHSLERNLSWESVIASLAATFATDVRFDEPDVTCTFENRTFAVAAKVAYSERKLLDNIDEGLRQANGVAEAALIFVNVGRLYPIVETFRLSRSKRFVHNDQVVSTMVPAFTRWCDRFPLTDTVKKIQARARQPIGVAFFVPLLLEVLGNPTPFFYTHLPVAWADGSDDDRFATAFLRACNSILGFTPRAEADR